MNLLSSSVSWKKLSALAEETANDRISDYFNQDPKRFDKMSLRLGELFLDFSKNKVNDEVLKALLELAEHSPLRQRRAQMFSGDIVNVTEKRPVLHTALRNRGSDAVMVDGEDVMPSIRASLEKLKGFSEQVRSGEWKGYKGNRITDIVNIGIGGSDLGPNMAVRALLHAKHPDLKLHFVSNVDGQHIKKVLKSLKPESTLFIVSTKTFSTQETLLNAQTARRWFVKNAGEDADVGQHFVAVSTNQAAAMEFGIRQENIFE